MRGFIYTQTYMSSFVQGCWFSFNFVLLHFFVIYGQFVLGLDSCI